MPHFRQSREFLIAVSSGANGASHATFPGQECDISAPSARTATFGKETRAGADMDRSVTMNSATSDISAGTAVTFDAVNQEIQLWCCQECSFAANSEASLTTHIRNHASKKLHKCGLCWHTFSKRGHLQDHMRTHTGERPFRCSICSRQFTQKSALMGLLCSKGFTSIKLSTSRFLTTVKAL
ncbi:hypothetical protein V5799_020055 [Amblyomma americanum]|uniref:C2H2-type domain-containing protein n=1 Tax=Amblyomma americanum TaxID=6943 RepID=A0AAQ4EVJ0_AMBAM